MKQAEEIIIQSADFKSIEGKFLVTQNSVKAASLTLCIPIKELIERLNNPTMASTLNDLSDAKNKIWALERTGDRLAQVVGDRDLLASQDWVNAKKL